MGVVWEGWLAVGLSYDLHRKVGGMAVPVKPHSFMRDEKRIPVADTKHTLLLVFWIHNKSGEKKEKQLRNGLKILKK